MVKNTRELRNDLAQVFDDLKSGKIEVAMSTELNRTANTIIKGIGQQIRYRKDRKEKPQIGFLNCE
jgi:hypothetical protein